MNHASSREWLFAFKSFAAAMLALGIGFSADLDRPYWAMASAYIASQPQAGTTRSKALYRVLGTLLGASVAVALVPNLVNAPNLLVASMAGWVALMLTLALLDRTPRGYVFMLAGYTAAIIGFPSVDTPGEIFATAVARTEEISLGVLCATLVSSLVFPSHVSPLILARMETWLQHGQRWARDALCERPLSLDAERDRRRLAADVIDISVLVTQLPFDVGSAKISMSAVRALHARLLMLFPLTSSVASRLSAFRASGGADSPVFRQLEDMARLLEGECGPDVFARLIAAIESVSTEREATDWQRVVAATLRLRLRDLATLIYDCGTLLRHLREGRPGVPSLEGGMEIEAASLGHSDPRMALYSGLSTGLAVALVCAFWIVSAWSEGAIAAEMCAVACCFFAAQDDPAPAIFRFMRWTVVAVVVDAIYLFAVLPAIDGFAMLVVALAPVFLLYGWLIARPATNSAGMALAVNGATLLALQSTYSADFATFANNGIATVIGMSAAAVITRLLRSVGADWSAWRLVRSNWISLADAAMGRGRGDRAAFAGLMIDRIGLVASRSNHVTAEQMPNMSKLQGDLRVGLNIVDLRRARRHSPQEVVQAIDGVLDTLSAYYRRLARGPLGRPKLGPDANGLAKIDEAISTVSSLAGGAGERDALQGLVGIRLGLYPNAPPPPEGGPAPTPIERKAAA